VPSWIIVVTTYRVLAYPKRGLRCCMSNNKAQSVSKTKQRPSHGEAAAAAAAHPTTCRTTLSARALVTRHRLQQGPHRHHAALSATQMLRRAMRYVTHNGPTAHTCTADGGPVGSLHQRRREKAAMFLLLRCTSLI
jgi:hypothetical protein